MPHMVARSNIPDDAVSVRTAPPPRVRELRFVHQMAVEYVVIAHLMGVAAQSIKILKAHLKIQMVVVLMYVVEATMVVPLLAVVVVDTVAAGPVVHTVYVCVQRSYH